MRFGFVMDPVEGMQPDKDTSFAFMRGALSRNHEVLHCEPRDVTVEGSRVLARWRPVRVSDTPPHATVGPPFRADLADVDAVLVRKDPPFDVEYLHLTQELELIRGRTLVMNDPAGLRSANEKLWALRFPHLTPRTLVTADRERIFGFVDDVGGTAVIKPLDGAGGSGVLVLARADKNARSIVDLHTSEGRRQAIVQEFLPEIARGDKRVLVLDGEPLGAILRVPRGDDVRANIHVGGTVEPTGLDDGEAAVVAEVGRAAREAGLYFVGLDLIGGRLIEVNVTSPTGIQELGRHLGTRPEEIVVEWLEREATRRKTGGP